ncbi:GDPmannose 4,6-dehydratase [Jatrophihabitans sp. GAS493]|nr:GDPmannose 4,6-dehydratase [Jatrophihabitans sp. GAS493]
MPRALITGITGQDGRYLTEKLLELGWDVHGVVREGDTEIRHLPESVPKESLHFGDLSNSYRVQEIVDAVQPDNIFNLGGISSVALSWQQPLMTVEVTGLGAAAVLEAAWQLQERSGRQVRVLQASSAEIFGSPCESPQTELTPIRPSTPYGAAKSLAHHLVSVYRGRGLFASSVILYNHESPRRPETFVTRKITSSVARIAAGKQDHLTLGNLEARRDWGWAPDYVDAIYGTISAEIADDFVVATGVAHSVRDFVAAAFSHAGIADWESLVSSDSQFTRSGDAPELVGDATKARERLGWRPATTFAEIVGRMVDHDIELLNA